MIKISDNNSLANVRSIKAKTRHAKNLVIDSNGAQCGIVSSSSSPLWRQNDGNAPTVVNGSNLNAPSSKVFSYKLNTTSMAVQTMPAPTIGHVYYGGCLFRSDAGFTATDRRFEWFHNDSANGLITFSQGLTSTNGEWVLYSGRGSLSSLASTSDWYLRTFVVNGTANSYSCKHIIIDLTETFGIGNEPSKEWCDKALREWYTFDGYSVGSAQITNDNWDEYFGNSAGTVTRYLYDELKANYDPREPSLCYEISNVNPEVYLYLLLNKFPVLTNHSIYVHWNEYTQNPEEEYLWEQTTRDVYGPEAEPNLFANYKMSSELFGLGGTFRRHARISGLANDRGFNQNPVGTVRIDINGVNVPGFLRLYNFYWADLYDSCSVFSEYQKKFGGAIPTMAKINKDWCDYWMRGFSLPIIHIADPDYPTGFDIDGNLTCANIAYHPEMEEGLYIDTNGDIVVGG